MIDGFEEPLELTRGSAVNDQHEGDACGRSPIRGHALVPLHGHEGFPWTKRRPGSHRSLPKWGLEWGFQVQVEISVISFGFGSFFFKEHFDIFHQRKDENRKTNIK